MMIWWRFFLNKHPGAEKSISTSFTSKWLAIHNPNRFNSRRKKRLGILPLEFQLDALQGILKPWWARTTEESWDGVDLGQESSPMPPRNPTCHEKRPVSVGSIHFELSSSHPEMIHQYLQLLLFISKSWFTWEKRSTIMLNNRAVAPSFPFHFSPFVNQSISISLTAVLPWSHGGKPSVSSLGYKLSHLGTSQLVHLLHQLLLTQSQNVHHNSYLEGYFERLMFAK